MIKECTLHKLPIRYTICFMAIVIAFASCDPKSMCSPAVLSMSPCTKNLDEEKVYIWRFGSVKWFWPSIFAQLNLVCSKWNVVHLCSGLIHAAGSFNYGNNSGLCSPGNDTILPSIPVCESTVQGNVKSWSRLNMLKMVASIFMAVFIAMLGSAIVILFIVWARSRKRPRISDGSETCSIPKEDTSQECETELKVAETSSSSNRFFRSFGSTRGSYGSTLQGSSCSGSMSDHQLARVLAASSFASSDQESPLPPSPSEFRLWISLNELEIATNYFSQKNLLRKSTHSAVYKGTLPSDGSAVAVKCVYNTRFWFGKKDLRFVIEALTHISHENVVQFKGFCVTKGGSECFLVYPFVAGGTLEQRLHGNVSQEKFLDWAMRVKIMGDVAKGKYLRILFHHASLIKMEELVNCKNVAKPNLHKSDACLSFFEPTSSNPNYLTPLPYYIPHLHGYETGKKTLSLFHMHVIHIKIIH